MSTYVKYKCFKQIYRVHVKKNYIYVIIKIERYIDLSKDQSEHNYKYQKLLFNKLSSVKNCILKMFKLFFF